MLNPNAFSSQREITLKFEKLQQRSIYSTMMINIKFIKVESTVLTPLHLKLKDIYRRYIIQRRFPSLSFYLPTAGISPFHPPLLSSNKAIHCLSCAAFMRLHK